MIAPAADDRGRRRILVVGPVPPPWHGCAVIIRNLLESQLTDRFELLHLDTTDARGIDNIGRLDVGNVYLAGVHGARFLHVLARQRPDIVYLTLAQNTWGFLRDCLFLSPAALARTRLVVHFQSGQFDAFYRNAAAPVRRLVRTLLPRADRAVVLGEVFVNMLDGLVPAERITVVPNAVPDPGRVESAGRSGSRVRVLYLGNLIAGKGYIDLIEAARLLIRDDADIEFVLAGAVADADVHRRALERARECGDRIRFAGPVDGAAKAELLRAADFLVFPSHYENEGHPLVLLEAMAAGLPVVSTHYAAIPETVVHAETGLLVEPRDVTALAAAIRRLAGDPGLRQRMGEAARARYVREYTLTRWAERMAAVFDDVLAPAAA